MVDAIEALAPEILPFSAPSALSAKINPNANIDAAAQDFEAMFAMQLLQPMFETVPVDRTFGGGHGEEIMRTFMLQEYGKLIAQKGLLGIAPQVKAEMLRAQENAQARNGATQPSPKTRKDVHVSRG